MDADQGLRSRAGHSVRDRAAVLTAPGALLYGMIALAYDRFYAPWAISARDVGRLSLPGPRSCWR
jgi:hypothetical protein